MTGFNNLTSLGGYLKIIENDSLISLSGLENIDYNSITDLYIINNPQLKECDVKSVCDYLANPDGTRDIHDNAVGCDNEEEILELCPNSIEDNYLGVGIQIFPNPATTFITIHIIEGIAIEEAIIYNHLGQKVLNAKPVNNTVDVSELKTGIYFIEVVTK